MRRAPLAAGVGLGLGTVAGFAAALLRPRPLTAYTSSCQQPGGSRDGETRATPGTTATPGSETSGTDADPADEGG